MAKAKNLVKQVNQATVTQIVHKPLILTPCTSGEDKFETTIQGKTITAYFAKNPDENILGLVKRILIDSHTHSHANIPRTSISKIEK